MQINPRFRPGRRVAELVAEGVLHPLCGSLFNIRLHQHQEFAIARIAALSDDRLERAPAGGKGARGVAVAAGHRRVRQAADARGRYEVRSLTPVDVIAAYVLIP